MKHKHSKNSLKNLKIIETWDIWASLGSTVQIYQLCEISFRRTINLVLKGCKPRNFTPVLPALSCFKVSQTLQLKSS